MGQCHPDGTSGTQPPGVTVLVLTVGRNMQGKETVLPLPRMTAVLPEAAQFDGVKEKKNLGHSCQSEEDEYQKGVWGLQLIQRQENQK